MELAGQNETFLRLGVLSLYERRRGLSSYRRTAIAARLGLPKECSAGLAEWLRLEFQHLARAAQEPRRAPGPWCPRNAASWLCAGSQGLQQRPFRFPWEG